MASFSYIDDSDGQVSYTGGWTKGGSPHEYDETVHFSTTVGDSFVVSFQGTGIEVYATIDSTSDGVETSYAIDGGTATTHTTGKVGGDTYKQVLYQSDNLATGAHQLKVTLLSVNSGAGAGEGTVWFDFFNVTQGAATTASPSGTSSTGGSNTSNTAKSSKSTSSAASGSSPSVVTTPTGTKHSNGGVVAAVVVILLLLLLGGAGFFLWRRRRTTRSEKYLPAPSIFARPVRPSTQSLLHNRPSTPMSGVGAPGPAPGMYGNSSRPTTPHSFDPRTTYAPSGTGQSLSQAAYDPYSSIGATMFSANPAPPSSYAPSNYGYAPSLAGSQALSGVSSAAGRTTNLSVVGGPVVDDDSVAELKRRQKMMVEAYEKGDMDAGGSQPPPIQHTDSGMRGDVMTTSQPAELPPVYSAN